MHTHTKSFSCLSILFWELYAYERVIFQSQAFCKFSVIILVMAKTFVSTENGRFFLIYTYILQHIPFLWTISKVLRQNIYMIWWKCVVRHCKFSYLSWKKKTSQGLTRDSPSAVFVCLHNKNLQHSQKDGRVPAHGTVYPKKYAHGFCFAVLCCGYTLTDFPISTRLTSLALWQSNDCPSASKATLMNMDKYFMWIHYMNDCITTTKQSTTKPCAYFLAYTVILEMVQKGNGLIWLCKIEMMTIC